ncbi:MAG: HD domain-containing protein, partial [Gammaproteobacteria bacterium]|nr:HD domain-containing protein [Gammaproteobacteria bacterium]
ALFDLLATRGTGRYGLSDVSQLEHALQSAALATERGLPDAQVIAALFHDVGHLGPAQDVDLAEQGIDDRHEQVGAEMLEPVFGSPVAEPVRLHVEAKRYLCAIQPGYASLLSADSVRSLALQGGQMGSEEATSFRELEHAEAAVALRWIDEHAKQAGLLVPGLDAYREMASRLAHVR